MDGPADVFGHSCGGLVTMHALGIAAASIRAIALYEPLAALASGAVAGVLRGVLIHPRCPHSC
ncbi:MAG TPA: hypothetical protein VHY58_06285 [Streptosporangiaceae bacterium]|nr:hypothetical protein [Streptosporangiaceae bacterium]